MAAVRWARRASVLLLASTLTGLPVDAQENPDPGTIVVTGKRQVTKKQAEHFVRQIVSISSGQLARFIEPVCPLALGVPPAIAAAMEDRIRQDATDARVRVAPGKCEPNLVAIVAKDGDSFIKFMRKRHSSFFNQLSDVDLHDAFRTGPVHAWRLVETRDEDGAPGSGTPPMVDSYSSSAFSTSTQAAAVNAVVVLDKKVVLDKTVLQLSDYVAMRTLAGAGPPRKDMAIPKTILSLFDSGTTPPGELTDTDASFLAGLYASKSNTSAPSQVFDISRQMTRSRPAEGRNQNR